MPTIADIRAASAHLNAWCDYPAVDVPAGDGSLSGLTLSVKDLFDVAGYPSGWGSPTHLAVAEPATETQSVVQAMIDAGARVVGKAQCEEFCFSLTGINAHYGAPVNPRVPERVTGGSSSGSVSLVAAGIVDIATGSDTGGSVRCPASHTGLIGLRATHGRLPLDRTMPLAHTFDVFGFFARDADTHAKVADVVLGEDEGTTALTRLMRLPLLDALLLGEAERAAYGRAIAPVLERFDAARDVPDFHRSIDDWYWAFRKLQAREAWVNLGDFITREEPELGPGVKERFEYGRDVPREEYEALTMERRDMIAWAEDLLGDDGLLLMPTMPSCAPLKDDTFENQQDYRERALRLLCVSGLSGLPQVSIPLAQVHGAPMGASLLGPRGSDRRLARIAEELSRASAPAPA